jgi:hypothetical protein
LTAVRGFAPCSISVKEKGHRKPSVEFYGSALVNGDLRLIAVNEGRTPPPRTPLRTVLAAEESAREGKARTAHYYAPVGLAWRRRRRRRLGRRL